MPTVIDFAVKTMEKNGTYGVTQYELLPGDHGTASSALNTLVRQKVAARLAEKRTPEGRRRGSSVYVLVKYVNGRDVVPLRSVKKAAKALEIKAYESMARANACTCPCLCGARPDYYVDPLGAFEE